MKFPKEKDRTAIDLLEASRRGGVPVESFTPAANSRLNEIATLDIVVIDGADWYKAAKQRNKNFSWGDMPDTEFVDSLFVEAWTFFRKCSQCFQTIKNQKIQKRLTKKTFLKLWAAVYFRVLPQQVNAIDEDYLELVYNFANTYTEEGIREWYRDINKEDSNTEDSTDNLLDLGYTWKEILEMQGTDNQENE